jgi:hypothetical protein
MSKIMVLVVMIVSFTVMPSWGSERRGRLAGGRRRGHHRYSFPRAGAKDYKSNLSGALRKYLRIHRRRKDKLLR